MSRLRLRPSATYARVPDGISFGGFRGSFVVSGQGALFPLVLALVPALDAGASRSELLALAPQAREVITYLLDQLEQNDLLLRLDDLDEASLSAEDRQRHPDTIAYFESLSADPYRAFKRWRAARVELTGPARERRLLRLALGRLGVGSCVDAGADAVASGLPDLRVVVGRASTGFARELRRARTVRPPMVALLRTGRGWIVVPDPAGGKAVADAVDRWRRHHVGRGLPERPNPLSRSLALNLAALKALHLSAGVADFMPPPRGIRQALVVGEDLQTRIADVPEGTAECGASWPLEDAEAAPPAVSGLLPAWERLADSDFGLVGAPATAGLPQVPVFTVGVATSAGHAHGCGLNHDLARVRAFMHGLARQVAQGHGEVECARRGGDAILLPAAHLTFAAGCSREDWLARGLAWAARDTAGVFEGSDPEVVELADLKDREARLWLKTLAVRLGVPAQVLVRRWGPLTEVQVTDGVKPLAVDVSCDGEIALRDALLLAVAGVQMERAGVAASFEPRTMPWFRSGPDEFPELGWSGAGADDLAEALHERGWEALAHRCQAEPAFASTGLVVGWVGLRGR